LAREQQEFRLADTLLVPSDFVLRTFLDRGFDIAQTARHQYGFDPRRFPAPGPEAPSAGGLPLSVCFVGLGEPRKGLHYALRAWFDSGLGERGRFTICGDLLPDYRRKLAPLLAHPSVETIGFVEEVGAVMRQSDVLVLPSVEEGSALVTYEGLASGCVLVVSDGSGAPCRHPDQALIHPAGDTQTLAHHLRMLDRDRGLLSRLRATGLARRGELTWAAAAARLHAIYMSRTSCRD
jgi:glycosyltransferase involved in cell wall biosynthesis